MSKGRVHEPTCNAQRKARAPSFPRGESDSITMTAKTPNLVAVLSALLFACLLSACGGGYSDGLTALESTTVRKNSPRGNGGPNAVAPPPPSTTTPPTSTTSTYARPGQNLGGVSYYSSTYPWINLVRSGGGWTSANWPPRSVAQDSNGWLTALPPTDSVKLTIAMVLNNQYSHLRSGNYKVKSASGATLGVEKSSGPGITNRSTPVVNQATFTIAPATNENYRENYLLFISVTNNTTSPIDVNDLAVYHVDDEADHLAGKLYQAAFKADLANQAVIRILDWTRANVSNDGVNVSNAADLPTEAKRSWAEGNAPYSVTGKLINEIKAAYPSADPWLHVTTVPGYSNFLYSMNAGADTITTRVVVNGVETVVNHGFTNGTPVMFYGFNASVGGLTKGAVYYVRDATQSTFKVAASPGASAVDITADLALDWGYHVDRTDVDTQALQNAIFRQLYAAAPSIKIKVEFSNEPWNSGFPQFHWLQWIGAHKAGTQANTPKGYAWASLVAWKAAENAGYTRAQVKRVLNGQAVYFGNMAGMFDYVDPGVLSAGTAVKDLADEYSIAPYIFPRNSAGGADLSVQDMINQGLHTGSDADWTTVMTIGVTGMASSVASTKTSLAAKRAGLVLSSYEGGHHVFHWGAPIANADALGVRFKQWLDSPAGLAWAQDYRQRVFIDNSVVDMVWFTGGGTWTSESYGTQQWGMKRGTHAPDTQISKWFKSL